ncbi:MAG: TIGR00282 family metallophosphoesterase [Syntrophales bacterium]
MKILFIGDIIGKPGRKAIQEILPQIISQYQIDFVIANCENAAGGFGVTRDIVEDFYQNRIDVLTSGNHIWDKKEIAGFIEDYETLLRPANYPECSPGHGSVIMPNSSGSSIGVLNLAGRVFMRPLDCPFRTALREIEKLEKKAKIIIVDIHAEATSEKNALGWFLDGKVSAVLGTHTHVQTADEKILPGGTAYITDAGMTGSFDSVIGLKQDGVVQRFLTQLPNKFEVGKNDVRLQGVVVDVDVNTGKSLGIERLSVKMKI